MNRKDILKEFEDKYGKDFIIKSEPEDYIHKGVDPSFNINDIKDFISEAISQTREETIRAIPEEMKYDPETDSEESKTWIAGFNNCRNQILNKLKK
jgi:hypothetical protein